MDYVKQKEAISMVDGDKLGSVGFKYIGTPYTTMDCQAFVEQCLRDCGCNKNLAGSNAWYREVYNNGVIMSPEDCVAQLGTVPKGAFLFILEHDGGEPAKYKPDGLGNASHIGLVTGTGEGAIHSSKSKGGVCESKFKNKTIPNGGWNKVGLWDQVSYNYGPGPSPTPTPEPDPPSPEPTPTPTPTPDPDPTYAVVWSENGKPVNTRKGPGKSYPLSKAGKLEVGTIVEVITKRSDGWDSISVVDKNDAKWYCYIMDQYLKEIDPPEPDPPTPEPTTTYYTVHIPHQTEEQADNIMCNYEDAWMTEE